MKHLIVLFLFFQLFGVEADAQEYKYHVVKDGETVYSISEKYNISPEIIYKYNPDAKNGIYPQSKLVVPINQNVSSQDVTFKEHRVKDEETLWSLSQQYNVEIEDIKRYNKHLYSEELQKGELVRIPVGVQEKIGPIEQPEQPVVKKNSQVNPLNPLNLSVTEHVVLPKENKFRISQKYNISVEELEVLNPGLGDILQPGMVLRISSEEKEERTALEDKLFKYYQVEPKETMFSLTRRLGISKDSLLVLNPALADGLKAGMVLKIPNLEEPEPVEDYSEENIVNLENHISNYETKDLVVMLPFKLDVISSMTDTTSNAEERIKNDKVLQVSLDFYSGVLMALDSAETHGISADVRIFDTKQSAYTVNSIINNNNFNKVDAVIGPLLQSAAETAAENLSRKEIPVISPLTKKETHNLENFIQTRPTDEMLAEAMISYLSKNAEGKNIVIIADASAAAKRDLIYAFTGARIVNPREGSYIDQSELSSALVKGRPNWVILESDNIGILSNATSYLNSLADAYDISLFTTNKNNSFESDNISNRHLANLNFHYPSVDKEFNNPSENSFVLSYKKKYGVVPNTYAVRGFDVTYDILLRLASAESLMESLKNDGTTEYVENKFDYDSRPLGGYLNKAIYIMAYTDDLKLKVIPQ